MTAVRTRRVLGPDASMALLRRARRLSGHLPPTWDRRLRETAKFVVNYRGARAGGLRAWQFRRLARRAPLFVAPFGNGQLLVDGRDNEISRAVFATGGYERIYMRTAVEYLRSTGRDTTGTAFLDVGAHIGTSSVDALLHFGFGRAICFEPEADNARLLALNMALNELDERVQIFPVALSDRDGHGVVARSEHNSGDNRVADDGAGAGDADLAPIELRRLDSLVAEGAVTLDDVGLVWMDVQGHEPFALAGACSVTDAGLPLVLEYTPAALAATGALGQLEALLVANYATVVDLHQLAHGCTGSTFPAREIPALAERYRGLDHTDLLLLP